MATDYAILTGHIDEPTVGPMLQIASGKFFATTKCYETWHRGIYYTNYRTLADGAITIPHGRLLPSTGLGGSTGTFTYEILEKIEHETPGPGVLISTGGIELVENLADVISFALNVLWSTDSDLVRRLALTPGVTNTDREHPSNFVRRVFDASTMAQAGDIDRLNGFLEALIGLERKAYEGAFSAIRRYVTAMHRISDDTSLAYALFVMSIEALAQTHDTQPPQWADYDSTKRKRIDEALSGASADMAERVRSAVLQNEHVALGRRFRDFATAHLEPAFFREEAATAIMPPGRPDLKMLLKRAYDIRSGYVHRLKDLPKLLARPFQHAETFTVDGQTTLTFEGLARLARHVIIQFVTRAPKVEHETFQWRAALPNIIPMQMSQEYWIGNPEGYSPEAARFWLRSFLEQIVPVLRRTQGAKITDLSRILDKIETMPLDNLRASERRPILALYHLFLTLAGPDYKRAQHQKLLERFAKDFAEPSVEELAVRLVAGETLPWPVEQLEGFHAAYYRERHHKNALPLGKVLEAMFTLSLAEANRIAGNEERARELITYAVEAFPGHSELRAFETHLGEDTLQGIGPRKIMLGEQQVTK